MVVLVKIIFLNDNTVAYSVATSVISLELYLFREQRRKGCVGQIHLTLDI